MLTDERVHGFTLAQLHEDGMDQAVVIANQRVEGLDIPSIHEKQNPIWPSDLLCEASCEAIIENLRTVNKPGRAIGLRYSCIVGPLRGPQAEASVDETLHCASLA